MTRADVEKLKKDAARHGTSPDGLYAEGTSALSHGNYKQARQKFRLAILYNPRLAAKVTLCYEDILENESGNMNARLSLADLHLYLGEMDQATAELEEILEIAPDRADVYNMLGKLYLKQGDLDSAIMLLESAFRSGMKDTALVEILAGAYIEKGRVNEAISLYNGLLEVDPNNRNYLRVSGDLLARVDNVNEAANRYYLMLNLDTAAVTEVIYKLEDLKKKHPASAHVREVLAEAFIKAIKPSLAVAELESVLNADSSKAEMIISKFKGILDKYPDEPTTLKALARTLTLKEQYSEAVAEYRKLMRFSGEHTSEAIAGFVNVLSRFPGQVHAHESLGDAYLKLGRTEEALLEYIEVLKLNSEAARSIIEKCRQVAKENTNMILIHQVLGEAYVLAGDGASAIEEAEFMIYLDKNNAAAHQIMGDAYLAMGDPQKARMSYAAAMGIDPYNITVHKKNEEAGLAIIRQEIDNLKKRIDEDPWRLGTHLDIAKLYLIRSDFDTGIKELQTAVKDNARAPFAYNLLGLSFVELGRFDLAETQFERALEVMPKELGDIAKSIRFNLGASFEAMGSVPAAIAQYETVLSEDLEFGSLQSRIRNLSAINQESQRNKMIAAVIERYGGRGIIGMWGADLRRGEATSETLNISFGQDHNNAGFEHFIKGRYKAAAEEFNLAVQLDPKFCTSLNNLAIILMKEGQMEAAETRLRHALSIDPDSPVLRNNLGVFLCLKGDLEGAAAELNRVLEADPNLSAAYINLGDIMYMKGSAQTAISLWEKIKSNDPISAIALRRLAYKTSKS
jgi:tetratricopeptide (TPR) repeat protein